MEHWNIPDPPTTVYMRLLGGLGNQLFQVAAALSHTKGMVVLISGLGAVKSSLDYSADIQGFALPDYITVIGYRDIPFRLSARKPLNLLHRTGLRSTHSSHWLKAHCLAEGTLSRVFSLNSGRNTRLIGGIGVGLDRNPRAPAEVQLMTGYFQSQVYAQSPRNENFISELQPRFDHEWLHELAILAKVEKPIIVHVRLGDYLGNNDFGSLTHGYYSKGLKYLRTQGLNSSKIWIYSDEPSKVHQFLPQTLLDLNPRIIENDGKRSHPASVMKSMSFGHGYVLANSTFGYWAAMMSSCAPHLVVVPEPWFANLADPVQLLPKKWKKVTRE